MTVPIVGDFGTIRENLAMAPNIPLAPPDSHCLKAAQGWLELGNLTEAHREFSQIHDRYQRHPEVLSVHWQIQAKAKNWETCLAIAQALVEVAPDLPTGWIHRSYSLHEMQRTQAAWDQLLPALPRFPEEPIIPYNLACYACQLQATDAARKWLQRAMKLGDPQRILEMALTDVDLKPLWEDLRAGWQDDPA